MSAREHVLPGSRGYRTDHAGRSRDRRSAEQIARDLMVSRIGAPSVTDDKPDTDTDEET